MGRKSSLASWRTRRRRNPGRTYSSPLEVRGSPPGSVLDSSSSSAIGRRRSPSRPERVRPFHLHEHVRQPSSLSFDSCRGAQVRPNLGSRVIPKMRTRSRKGVSAPMVASEVRAAPYGNPRSGPPLTPCRPTIGEAMADARTMRQAAEEAPCRADWPSGSGRGGPRPRARQRQVRALRKFLIALSRAGQSRSPLVPLRNRCVCDRYRDQSHRKRPPPHAWGWRELVDED